MHSRDCAETGNDCQHLALKDGEDNGDGDGEDNGDGDGEDNDGDSILANRDPNNHVPNNGLCPILLNTNRHNNRDGTKGRNTMDPSTRGHI